MSIEKSIQDEIQKRKENITKGIVDFGSVSVSPKQTLVETNSELEKARNAGETKVGKDGITRVWTQLPNGKFDWRRQTGKPKAASSEQQPKQAEKKEQSEEKKSNKSESKFDKQTQKEGTEGTLTKDLKYNSIHRKDSWIIPKGSKVEFKKDSIKVEYLRDNKQVFTELSRSNPKQAKSYNEVQKNFKKGSAPKSSLPDNVSVRYKGWNSNDQYVNMSASATKIGVFKDEDGKNYTRFKVDFTSSNKEKVEDKAGELISAFLGNYCEIQYKKGDDGWWESHIQVYEDYK